jgi:DNA-binding NarL/FixJ family response regulator
VVTDATIRVVIADDHVPMRVRVRQALEDGGCEVVGEGANADDAVRLAMEHRPDVALLDIQMPGSGIRAAAQIAKELPETAIVMLTQSREDEDLFDSLRAGASGYLLKDAEIPEIVKAIRAAAAGYSTFAPEVAGALAANVRENLVAERPAPGAAAPPLSAREREVLALLAAGCDNVAIARQLYISPSTVKNHVSRLLEKLGVDNRVQAAGYAIRHGLVDDRFARTGTPVAG